MTSACRSFCIRIDAHHRGSLAIRAHSRTRVHWADAYRLHTFASESSRTGSPIPQIDRIGVFVASNIRVFLTNPKVWDDWEVRDAPVRIRRAAVGNCIDEQTTHNHARCSQATNDPWRGMWYRQLSRPSVNPAVQYNLDKIIGQLHPGFTSEGRNLGNNQLLNFIHC